jgi:hypothetical protein
MAPYKNNLHIESDKHDTGLYSNTKSIMVIQISIEHGFPLLKPLLTPMCTGIIVAIWLPCQRLIKM